MSDLAPDAAMEDLEEFRMRARNWIRAHLRRIAPGEFESFTRGELTDEEQLAEVAHERELQRRLFDAGLAGICVPRAYGGQDLSPAHQTVLNEELIGYEYPA